MTLVTIGEKSYTVAASEDDVALLMDTAISPERCEAVSMPLVDGGRIIVCPDVYLNNIVEIKQL